MISNRKVVVLVPIYREHLSSAEQRAMDHSLRVLELRDVRFIAPMRLDLSYYKDRYPDVVVELFPSPCFESIAEYNRLLLSEAFYNRYSHFEYTLILQTDAVVLRDELDYWCNQPFDYIGAPWPKAYELMVQTGRFEGVFGKHVRVHVGNGGLSLRRNRKCVQLLHEFSVELELFVRTASSEDLFFSVMGALSQDFVIPNEVTSSLFSMESDPRYYFKINGGRLPMGGHAWEKNDPAFWSEHI